MELFQKPEPAKPRKTAPALRPATAALNGGLMPNSVTGAIQPDISMSVNNVFAPGSAGFSAEGALNVPIGEKVALRAAFQGVSREGYISDGTDDDKHHSFRLQLKAEPTESLTLRLGLNYQHLGGRGPGKVVYEPTAPTAPGLVNSQPIIPDDLNDDKKKDEDNNSRRMRIDDYDEEEEDRRRQERQESDKLRDYHEVIIPLY